MRKIKDVLRLIYEADLSCRQIAASLKLSVGVISKYTKAAATVGLSWPLPEGMDDTTLAARLFPYSTAVREHVMPATNQLIICSPCLGKFEVAYGGVADSTLRVVIQRLFVCLERQSKM